MFIIRTMVCLSDMRLLLLHSMRSQYVLKMVTVQVMRVWQLMIFLNISLNWQMKSLFLQELQQVIPVILLMTKNYCLQENTRSVENFSGGM